MPTFETPELPQKYVDELARIQAQFVGMEFADHFLALVRQAVVERIAEIRKEEGVKPVMSA